MSSPPVISAKGLRKSYGEFEAVKGINLQVESGEIFAFLGPNGAGKTTTVEIFEGYRDRTGGEVEVLGVDPSHPTNEWRARVGVVLQECELAAELTVNESVSQYAGYYQDPRGVEETIDLVGLADKADSRAGRLSGGQRRRLDVALALVGDPDLLFLDEPTTGFDPLARRQAWDVVRSLRDLGKTVFLTTHYMEEAQELADRVAILAAGEIVAEGPPDELGGSERAVTRIDFTLPGGEGAGGVSVDDLPDDVLAARVPREPGQADGTRVHLRTPNPTALLASLTGWAVERGVELESLEAVRPSLEDVYLELTGVNGAADSGPHQEEVVLAGRGRSRR
ncbi:MAG: ABC transporter ATP-binding protein [bacterium]